MKDYKLSEIIDHCKSCEAILGGCAFCQKQDKELADFCSKVFSIMPIEFEIAFEKSEQRDIIEIPCKVLYKEKVMSQTIVGWQIIYRSNEGYIDIKWFTKENDADKFLSELKGEK